MTSREPIDPRTRLGAVGLVVADLERSLDFYCRRMGLEQIAVHERSTGREVVLGVGACVLLRLLEQRGARPVARGRTGLYHFALLLPDRASLGRLVARLVEQRVRFSGTSDHGVSEALYLDDPDGHGIELYRDRPRAEWPRLPNGELAMTLDPLDIEGLLAAGRAAPNVPSLPESTVMGHVHLHVADLAAAERFYVRVLGFDLMQRFAGQAAFVSAGGYHHHLGLNVWAGVGAPPPDENAARLRWVEILLPNVGALHAVRSRLAHAEVPTESGPTGLFARDPSANGVWLRCAASDPL